jgi:hypothetical protein
VTGFVYFLQCTSPHLLRPVVYVGATNRTIARRFYEHLTGCTDSLQGFARAEFLKALRVNGTRPFAVEHYLKTHRRAILPLLSDLRCQAVDDFFTWLAAEHVSVRWVTIDEKPEPHQDGRHYA